MDLTHLYLSWNGRISRQTFWLKGMLPILAYTIVMFFVCQYVSNEMEGDIGLWEFLFAMLLAVWPLLAVSAKRWHDRGKSAWWLLFGAIPFIGWAWVFVETGFLKGTPGSNRFGEKSY